MDFSYFQVPVGSEVGEEDSGASCKKREEEKVVMEAARVPVLLPSDDCYFLLSSLRADTAYYLGCEFAFEELGICNHMRNHIC